VFGISVYLLSENYGKRDFLDRLKERVLITEKLYLEKSSFSSLELEKISNQFLNTLPEETEEVVELIQGEKPNFVHNYPAYVQGQLHSTDFFYFKESERLGSGKIFEVDEKKYLIIVTAVNQIGLQNLRFLRNVILFSVLLVVPLLFLGSFFIANKALLPISNKIEKANAIEASNLHLRLNVHNPKDELGRLAIAVNKLLDRLQASFEAQKSFIRNASHEIRNPLTAIMGEAEITISKDRTTKEYKEAVEVILSEAEVLNSTVNNLLQLSKISGSLGDIKYESFNFDQFLAEVKTNFDFQNKENQLSVSVDPIGPDESYTTSGNKNLLKTTIINLFDNASKFSSNEPVEVRLSKDSRYLMLSIKDQGIGIHEEDLEKVKSPFFRGNNALAIRGSGIGLSLSSKIISLHQGKLEIFSELNTGTKILIKLPLDLA
jgi:signal transduction histidine kinase